MGVGRGVEVQGLGGVIQLDREGGEVMARREEELGGATGEGHIAMRLTGGRETDGNTCKQEEGAGSVPVHHVSHRLRPLPSRSCSPDFELDRSFRPPAFILSLASSARPHP